MTFKPTTAIAALLLAVPTLAIAEADDDTLIVNDELEMVTKAAAPAHLADDLDEVISGWHFRSDETQALQMDDFDNPGLLGVELAIDAWETVEGTAEKSCASCHGDVEESMAGVRAVYPKWNEA
ncbi:MAG: sulfur oxidation c-type cytochrome SoxA, partial [Pseudomonadota bacterium]|nr:sulfur oxidation c-type cytochrome SoxA [Pseudomonadota bacterium]